MMAALSWVYTGTQAEWTEPLAWPYHATVERLQGMPPHFVNVNELDPLRDEGLAYYRKLLAAGVDAIANVAVGTVHCGDLMPMVPDTMQHNMENLRLFALRVADYRAACSDTCSVGRSSANDGICQETGAATVGGPVVVEGVSQGTRDRCPPGTDETDCQDLPGYEAVCRGIVDYANGR